MRKQNEYLNKNITKQGLRKNWLQFSILLLVNAFVGGMVGMERSILPEIATQEMGLNVKTAILSFIVAFGISKALTNYFTGKLANRFGRKNLLILGWVFALPVPFLLIYAPNWNWVIVANILLGINQGLAWSSTVVMKIDLVGDKERGLAMGLNEFSGYLAVGLVAFLTASIADDYGLRPYPFYIGIVLSVLGLVLSVFVVKDTRPFVQIEQKNTTQTKIKGIFWQTTWQHPNLGATTQAGLINNLNDGMIWGLLPLLLLEHSFSKEMIGLIIGAYPTVWGVGQLITGRMADFYSHKKILFYGMLMQGIAILTLVLAQSLGMFLSICIVLGIGTALVYPTFLVVIAENTTPKQRPESIGTFRLWRDLGYAIGAILSGLIADAFGITYAIGAIGILTVFSAIVIYIRMTEKDKSVNF